MSERILAVMGDKTQADFGESIGVSAQAVNQWLKGKTEPGMVSLRKISELYKVDLNWLAYGKLTETDGQQRFPQPNKDDLTINPVARVETPLGARDLPVFAAVEGGDGDLVVSTEPVDLVPRPWYLGEVKDGYGVIVTGDSMVPAYDPGDTAIVNPRLPFMRGKVHIFTCESENSHFKASIKMLVKVTETEWIVEQHNPPKTYSLPRSIWTHARRVVGKYNG
jgi:phage repressor protein C with HTH and peptisase S24 domain